MTTTQPKKKIEDLPLYKRWLAGAAAASTAEFFSLPFDTGKVRLQLQDKAKTIEQGKIPYTGMINVLSRMIKEEGFTSLFKGLSPGIQRQCVFGGLRLMMYEPIRDSIHTDKTKEVPLYKKIIAGVLSGSIAITIANPTDLVKIRLQGDRETKRYNGSIDAYKKIVKGTGFWSLWTGLAPNIVRNSTINTAELVSYDEVKMRLKKSGLLEEGTALHFASSLTAGFIATVVGSPVDVLKTRVMNSQGLYNGVFDCIFKTLKNEGFMAFYKGFTLNYTRIGSWNVIMFMTFEKIKSFLL